MRFYRTQHGDQWDMIAFRHYPNVGREMCMAVLLEANQEHRETVIFPAGVTLQIPDVEIPAVQRLPPWKRR